jgi:ADP-heptose:LPS heptosyltransferase
LRTLKTQLTGAEVDYLVDEENSFLLQENPYVKSVIPYTSKLRLSEKYDAVIDLEGSARSAKVAAKCKAKTYSFNPLKWKNWLLTNFKINQLPNQHLTDRFYEVAAPLGIKPDALGLDVFLPEKDSVPTDWLPNLPNKGYVVLSLTAGYNTRRLPTKRLIELCDKINKPVLLLGNPEETTIAQAITNFFERSGSGEWEEGLNELGKRTEIINACGQLNFNQQASLIKQAAYVFSFDSWHLAVASAFQKQIFSIWGNTIPEMGKYPYRSKFLLFEKKGLSCRPCSPKGYDSCPKQHFNCMNGITFDFYLP